MIAIFLENMAADGNVNNLVNTIVYHPAFRETINAILTGSNTHPSSSVSPASVQTDNRSTNVTSPIGSTFCNKNFQQFLEAEVTQRFNVALTTGIEDLRHLKEQQQERQPALSTEIESFGQKKLFCYQEELKMK